MIQWYKRNTQQQLATKIALVVLVALSGWIATTVTFTKAESFYSAKLEKQVEIYEVRAEELRERLIEGLYTADVTIAKSALTYDDRVHIYMREAKGLMLAHNADSRMSNDVIDELLLRNFKLAEQYGMHPAMFLAFAQVESGFHPRAVSVANARGIVQFMPATAAWVLGDEYEDNIEFNPVKSVDIWYRYVAPFVNYFGGDVEWIAAAYLSPHALRWHDRGKTVDEYLEWVASWSYNPVTYSNSVKVAYHDLKDRIYHNYIDSSRWITDFEATN